MKKIVITVLLFSFLVGVPGIFSVAQSKTTKKPINKQKVVKKNFKKVVNTKNKVKRTLALFFAPNNPIVNCAMPDGKTIKATKTDCDSVTSFWASHKSSPPSNGGSSGGGSSSNNSSNNNSNSNNDNNNSNQPAQPSKVTPTIFSIVILPCTSSSCYKITTIVITGSGFNENTLFELAGSGVLGNYVGGNFSTEIIMDFINLPDGTYNLKVYSTNRDRKSVV